MINNDKNILPRRRKSFSFSASQLMDLTQALSKPGPFLEVPLPPAREVFPTLPSYKRGEGGTQEGKPSPSSGANSSRVSMLPVAKTIGTCLDVLGASVSTIGSNLSIPLVPPPIVTFSRGMPS